MVFLVKLPLSFPTNERNERVSLAPAILQDASLEIVGAFFLPFFSLDITLIVSKTVFTLVN